MNNFFRLKRNERYVIHFHRPFLDFIQNWTINGKKTSYKRFAYNCLVGEDEPQLRILNVGCQVASIIEEYAKSKALKNNAVVIASVCMHLPDFRSPRETKFIVNCTDSYPSFTRFPWKLSKQIDSIREIKIGNKIVNN
jgi:hypothetical protein